MALLAFCLLFLVSFQVSSVSSRSFTIDYEDNVFLKDGQPFRYVSGSMHYFRVPRAYWRDRMTKMKAAGLDVLQTYVAWNVHERVEEQYDFEGDNDLVKYIQLADSLDLLVIVRAGPFIAAERDMGGFPPWLLKNYTLSYAPLFRTLSNTDYIRAVDRWMSVLLPKLRPLTYASGGPVIAVQVENEYGSIQQCDHKYMWHLETLFEKHLGTDVVLFTNNGCTQRMLECGTLPTMLTTLDFGGGGKAAQRCFTNQRFYHPTGPLVDSEFYPGWLANWGIPFPHVPADTVANDLDELLNLNISVNFYMFHGGTNFGFMNGANFNNGFKPQLTSYDYDAPLSEAGDPTPKYMAIREVILRHKGLPPLPVPPATPKHAYGTIQMTKLASIWDVLLELSAPGPSYSQFPKSMESVGQNYGFMLYHTQIPTKFSNKTVKMGIQGLHDRGILFIGKVRKATFSRSELISTTVSIETNLTLNILVENQGHITRACDDVKGIIGNVSINGDILSNWEMYKLNLTKVADCGDDCFPLKGNQLDQMFTPTFYAGKIPPTPDGIPKDTFLKFPRWNKGQMFVNGFNLGRYWPVVGPQETLYLPAPLLSSGFKESTLLLLELDNAPCATPEECFVESVSVPILNGTVHPYDMTE